MCTVIMIRTFAKCFFQYSYTFAKVMGLVVGNAMIRDAIDQVGIVNRKIVTSVPIDVYHIYPDSVHSDGCKDRDQSRDWCAFAANGMGLDQTVPAKRAEPRAASRRNLATDNRAQRRSPNSKSDRRLRHQTCDQSAKSGPQQSQTRAKLAVS